MTDAKHKPARAQGTQWSTMPHARAGIGASGNKALTRSFETERCPFNARQLADQDKSEAERRRELDAFKAKRRGSPMVKKQRPHPVLKPSPALAAGPDRAAHNDQIGREHRQARRAAWLAEALAARDGLYALKENAKRMMDHASVIDQRAASGDTAGALRESFKIMRRFDAEAKRAVARGRAVTRGDKGR